MPQHVRQGTILETSQTHTNYLHEQIQAALDSVEDRSDLKVIVAPSAAAAASIRTALARSGRGLVNLEALTASGLAFHVLKTMDPAGARRMAGSITMECVIAGALSRREEDPMAALFSRSVSAITRTVATDRMAGRRAAWAQKNARGSAQHLYAHLFEVYESYLSEHDLFDQASVLERANLLVDQFRSERHVGRVLVVAETTLVPGQVALLQSLAADTCGGLVGHRKAEWPANVASNLIPEWGLTPTSGSEEDSKRQREPQRSIDSSPKVLQAATRREEVMAALQEIRDGDLSVSDVELAVTDPVVYMPLIRAVAARLSIPTSCEEAGEHSAYLRLVVSLLEWMHSPSEARELAGILRSGRLFSVDNAAELATTLDEFPVSMGMLDRPGLRDSLMEGARRNWSDLAAVDALLQFLRVFRSHRWPSMLSPENAVRRLRESVYALLGDGESTAGFWYRIEDLLEGLRDAPQEPLPSRWLSSRIATILADNSHALPDSGSSIMVVPLAEAGYGPRSHTWVLGMDDKASARSESQEGTHFAGLEPVREGMKAALVRHRIAELRRRKGAYLTLCAPAFDEHDGRGLFPSAALIEHGHVHELQPVNRQAALDIADAATSRSFGTRFQAIEQGRRALAARRSDQWTAWDGRLPSTPEGEKPNLRVSTSRMEMLATCPFKYWLSEILKVPVAPQPSDEWLSASDLGLMVHDLFEQHTRSRAASKAGTGPEDEKAMLLQLRVALERQAIRSGADRPAAVGQRYEELAQSVEQYFDRERSLQGQRKPIHAEYPIHEVDDPESKTIRLELPSGSISLSGRIDRIDETVAGTWVIVDYKTGSWKDFVPAKLKSLDSKLQWALYSMAAARLSGKTVEKAEYVFTSRRGSGWVSAAAPPPEDVILGLLDVLLMRFQSGAFVQAAQKNGVCTWCDFKAVCGDLDERNSQLRAKFEHGSAEIAALYDSWPKKS